MITAIIILILLLFLRIYLLHKYIYMIYLELKTEINDIKRSLKK